MLEARAADRPASPGNAGCPRCGAAFHCGANEPLPCACAHIKLDAASARSLRAQFDRCVCMACLAQLQTPP